jgi:hypothetical protein
MDAHRLDRGVPGPSGVIADLSKGYLEWMPRLTTRADLTFKRWAALPALEGARAAARLVLDDNTARAMVTRAMNRILSHVVRSSRSLRHRPRLDAVVWLERGGLSGRPHVHALIERPTFCSPESFANVIGQAWQAQPLGHRQCQIEEIRDLRGSLRYNMKAGEDPIYLHKEPDETAWWRQTWLRDWEVLPESVLAPESVRPRLVRRPHGG